MLGLEKVSDACCEFIHGSINRINGLVMKRNRKAANLSIDLSVDDVRKAL